MIVTEIRVDESSPDATPHNAGGRGKASTGREGGREFCCQPPMLCVHLPKVGAQGEAVAVQDVGQGQVHGGQLTSGHNVVFLGQS